MTDKELADILCARKAVSVTLSKDGCFIRSEGIHRAITTEQAEIALLAIQDIMRGARPISSTLETKP